MVWGTFTLCSAVSAIGFASANRTFTVDAQTVQAALNQSRLASLEADQSELRRIRAVSVLDLCAANSGRSLPKRLIEGLAKRFERVRPE